MVRRLLLLLLVALSAVAGCFRKPPETAGSAAVATDLRNLPAPKVRLAVLVVFDQMRADYLERWRPHFGPDGFNRLMTDGAWFANCRYPYATTTTGPGHASILTGCSPDRHGIINNNWFDRTVGEEVYCAGTPRYTAVPPEKKKAKYGGSPDRLLSPTVADVLKQVSGGRGKVIGLSLKDRGAILPTGKHPDGAYWFDDRFGTSTYYTDALPRWVVALNGSHVADTWFGKPWDRFRADLDYDQLVGTDSGPAEGGGTKQGIKFPHPMTGGGEAVGSPYYAALESSPFGNELLLASAKAAVDAEHLGADNVPDLLVVSFSANDLIGHSWGPDSQEVFDVTLRSDALMADFLGYLDGKVGKDNYLVVLTADHGVYPPPEASVKAGRDARRVVGSQFAAAADKFLREKYGPAPGKPADPKATKPVWLEAVSPPYLYLNQKLLRAKKIDPAAAADALAGWVRTQPGVARAFTRREIMAGPPPGDAIAAAVRKAYYPDRAGDVYVVLSEWSIFGSTTPIGTTHGSPYEHDTHVPLLAYGPGIPGGKRTEPVVPQHAAAIASALLGLPLPRDCEYEAPATLTQAE